MCIHSSQGPEYPERASHPNHLSLSTHQMPTDQHDLVEKENAVSLVQDLFQALNLANTDQINLTLSRWKKMNEEGNKYIPASITDLFKTISSKPEKIKYSYAVRQRELVATVLRDMVKS